MALTAEAVESCVGLLVTGLKFAAFPLLHYQGEKARVGAQNPI